MGKGVSRTDGGGLGCPKWGVAQKLGKTRQNGRYAVFGGPPIPTYTPRYENRATAVLTPFPGISASAENPDSRSATETPTDYPVPAAHGSTPVQYLDRPGGTPKRKNPARGGVRFQHHLSDYAGRIVLNAPGILRLSRSINRRVRSTNPPRFRHHPRRVPP